MLSLNMVVYNNRNYWILEGQHTSEETINHELNSKYYKKTYDYHFEGYFSNHQFSDLGW